MHIFPAANTQELKPQLEEIDGIEASVDELLGTAQVCEHGAYYTVVPGACKPPNGC